eukprot:3649508-Prymnesium_polylepis.1
MALLAFIVASLALVASASSEIMSDVNGRLSSGAVRQRGGLNAPHAAHTGRLFGRSPARRRARCAQRRRLQRDTEARRQFRHPLGALHRTPRLLRRRVHEPRRRRRAGAAGDIPARGAGRAEHLADGAARRQREGRRQAARAAHAQPPAGAVPVAARAARGKAGCGAAPPQPPLFGKWCASRAAPSG